MFTHTTLLAGRSSRQNLAMTGALALALAIAAISPARAVSLQQDQSAPQASDESAARGAQIVAYARAHLGQAVGDGECYDLADQALRHVGAKSAPDFGEITGDADYVWGKPVALRDARPGDIVQFHNFTLRTTVTGNEMLGNGQFGTSQRWDTEVREHHTSIVEKNLGGTLVLLEQNVEPGLVVQRTTLAVASGTVDGSPDGEPAFATTTYQVAGDAHVYRPEPANNLLARE